MGDAFNQVHELMEERNITAHTSESEPNSQRSEKIQKAFKSKYMPNFVKKMANKD